MGGTVRRQIFHVAAPYLLDLGHSAEHPVVESCLPVGGEANQFSAQGVNRTVVPRLIAAACYGRRSPCLLYTSLHAAS